MVWRFEKMHFMEWRVKRKCPFSFLRHLRHANCSPIKSGAILEIIQDLSRIFLSLPYTYKRNWNGTLSTFITYQSLSKNTADFLQLFIIFSKLLQWQTRHQFMILQFVNLFLPSNPNRTWSSISPRLSMSPTCCMWLSVSNTRRSSTHWLKSKLFQCRACHLSTLLPSMTRLMNEFTLNFTMRRPPSLSIDYVP